MIAGDVSARLSGRGSDAVLEIGEGKEPEEE